MHIISASRRTDIPAFHADWFMNRVRAGAVEVALPFGKGTAEVSLRREDVIATVFWTKHAGPILPYLDELLGMGHPFTFLYTINNYPISVEPRVPSVSHTLSIVRFLCERFSSAVFRWRYDTIVITPELNRERHLRNFRFLCEKLSPYTSVCIFSFCDYYRKTLRNMNRLLPGYIIPEESFCRDMAQEMSLIADETGISLASCAHDFQVSGKVTKARCIDPTALWPLMDTDERKIALNGLKAAPTRKDCGCIASRDIGAYNTCMHGCVYCYANADPGL